MAHKKHARGDVHTSRSRLRTEVAAAKPARRDGVGDAIVIACALLVSLAVGSALYARGGIGMELSAIAAIATLLILVLGHALLRSLREISRLREHVAAFESANARGTRPQTDEPARTEVSPRATIGVPDVADAFAEEASAGDAVRRHGEADSSDQAPHAAGPEMPIPQAEPFAPAAPLPQLDHDVAPVVYTGIGAHGPRHDLAAPDEPLVPRSKPSQKAGIGGFFKSIANRKKDDRAHAPAESHRSQPRAESESPRRRVVSGWTGKSESLQRVIGGAPAAEPAPPVAVAPADLSTPVLRTSWANADLRAQDQPAEPAAGSGQSRAAARTVVTEAAHNQAPPPAQPVMSASAPIVVPPVNPVDGLIREIAAKLSADVQGDGRALEAMRALPAPELAEDHGAGDSHAKDHDLLVEAVSEAVEDGAIDVYLQPIVTIDGLSTVSYEAIPVLKTRAGDLIDRHEYEPLAHRAKLHTGIEQLCLLRAIHILQQLESRQKLCPIFCRISPELLVDGAFFANFVDAMKGSRGLSTHLVLTFAQPAAEGFGEAELDSLDALSRMGFTFALTDVYGIEIDFEPLIARGLSFVKMHVPQFREGLAAGDSVIATADIKALFEEAGLQLVVEDIRSEDEFDLVAEHAILYGQGSLFSDPIPVKSEVLGESHEAA